MVSDPDIGEWRAPTTGKSSVVYAYDRYEAARIVKCTEFLTRWLPGTDRSHDDAAPRERRHIFVQRRSPTH